MVDEQTLKDVDAMEQKAEELMDQAEAGEEEEGEETEESSPSALQEAKELEKRINAKMKKFEDLILRAEELSANERLRGKSSVNLDKKKQEETPKEYADRLSKGQL